MGGVVLRLLWRPLMLLLQQHLQQAGSQLTWLCRGGVCMIEALSFYPTTWHAAQLLPLCSGAALPRQHGRLGTVDDEG